MDNQKKNKRRHSVFVAICGLTAVFTVVTSMCLQSRWQPGGYRTTPVVCPPHESDSRGYCFVHREDGYAFFYHPSITSPKFIHISRGSGPREYDIITTVGFSGGKFFTITHPVIDPYPPQNSTDRFVQSVRDRRTELYSEMGWPDPNPPPMSPLNH